MAENVRGREEIFPVPKENNWPMGENVLGREEIFPVPKENNWPMGENVRDGEEIFPAPKGTAACTESGACLFLYCIRNNDSKAICSGGTV